MSGLLPNKDVEVSSTPQSGKGTNVLWMVLACLGCAGLGVFMLIMLSILAAIALPSFLNQARRAKAAEAKAAVGSVSRGQQAYFLAKESFASSIEELGLGLKSQTSNYTYGMEVQPDGTSVIITATPVEEPLKYYTGAVFVVEDPFSSPNTTVAQICESYQPLELALPSLNIETQTIDCPPNSIPL